MIKLDVKISPDLQQAQETYHDTSSVQSDVKGVNTLHEETEENLCDLSLIAIKAIMKAIVLPGVKSIAGLLSFNINIGTNLKSQFNLIQKTFDLPNLIIPLIKQSWQIFLVFGLQLIVAFLTTAAMLLTLFQEFGYIRNNNKVNQLILPSIDQIIFPLSMASFDCLLSAVGIFSFLDKFDMLFFNCAVEYHTMFLYGLFSCMCCFLLSLHRFYFKPI